jgi:formylmethanofuran dehydrogenase subunit A
MDVEFRKEQIRKLPPEAQKRIVLADIDRQYTLSDVAIITSAGPARALGLAQKGHLGAGADADITIYPEKPNDQGVLFSYPRYVLKRGQVVVEEGEVRTVTEGHEFVTRPAYDETIEEYIRPLFQKVYTMSFENYPVEIERLRHPDVTACK